MVVSRGKSRNTDGRFVGSEKNKVEKSVIDRRGHGHSKTNKKKYANKCRRVSDSQNTILPLFDVDWCAN